MRPLEDAVSLGAIPLAEARPAIEASLNRFARVHAYESWLAKAEEQALAEAICVGDQLPAPAALTLDDLLPLESFGRLTRMPRQETRHQITKGGSMAGKADFTEEEWEQLRKGATGAGLLVSDERPQLLRQLQGGGLAGASTSPEAAPATVSSCASSQASAAPASASSRSQAASSRRGRSKRSARRVATLREEATRVDRELGELQRVRRPTSVDAYGAFMLEVAEPGRQERPAAATRPRPRRSRQDQAGARLKQSSVWSSTRPADCMKA